MISRNILKRSIKPGLIPAFSIILLFSNSQLIYSQDQSDCKVLKTELIGKYQGGCNNGLAEGYGVARGQETYIGAFRKGLPEGKGEYSYSDGSVYKGFWKKGLRDGEGEMRYRVGERDSMIAGLWKNDKFTGKSKSNSQGDYEVIARTGIEDYSIKRFDDPKNSIGINFTRVMDKYIPRDLDLTTSNGHITRDALTMTVRDFICPVYCEIRFTIRTAGGDRICNLSFKVLRPGRYIVEITNN
jgi:hypothetical protein